MSYRGPFWRGGVALILLSTLVGTLGCHRQKPPSQEFASANRLFVRIYGEKLEDAYMDPRMAQVEQLLSEVAVASADYAAAQQLLTRIRTGREKALAELNARQAAVGKANTPVQMTSGWTSSPRPEASDQAVDAGHEPASGMALSDFTHEFSDCFSPWKPVQLTEQGVEKGTVDSWELKDIANCRDRHPGFQDRVVLTNPKKVLYVVNRALLETRAPDAGSR
jgi:hypothetical protein